MNNKAVGLILNTGSSTGEATRFQQLVTIDAPTSGKVIDSCIGRQGVYFLTEERVGNTFINEVYILPQPSGNTDVAYESAPKQEFIWRSKKFVMRGRTTFGAAKVVHSGCVRLKIIVDGCCVLEEQVRTCSAFRLPSQFSGVEFEIELTGTGTVYEVHVASSMQELLYDN